MAKKSKSESKSESKGESKSSGIKAVLDAVNKEWGAGSLIIPELGGHLMNEEVEVLSTGCGAIDEASGIGGWPMGRIVEVTGMESSGKSTLVLHTLAEAQRKGWRCALIDTEHALDVERAKRIGLDYEKMAVSQPDNGEQALEILEFLIHSREFRVIAVDSVAALTPKAELEGEMSDANIGLQARMMGKIMRKITAPVSKYKCLVIFTNQLRTKIGGFGYFPQTTTPGGNALKFYASMRVEVARTANKKNSKGELQYTTNKATFKKNKMAVPARVADFKIDVNGIVDDTIE